MNPEQYQRKRAEYLDRLILKNPDLDLLQKHSKDQYSYLIQILESLLQQMGAHGKLVLPDLSAFTNNSLRIFSDYSGEARATISPILSSCADTSSCSSQLAISYHPDNIRRKNVRKLVSTLVLCLSLVTTVFAAPNAKVYNYTLKSIDGNPTNLSQFQGKVLFLVNVASSCGYTPQYKALEAVYEKYKDRGLVIVGIPANNFANQESGTDAEIKTFCSKKYNVTFPMMSKVSVKGADQTPLYKYLTDKTANPTIGGDIKWNFTKFIFDRNGKPIARFEPATTPDSLEVIAAIESALKQ